MKIASVIKYEGDNGAFIWKHPEEDFNSMTQLIVHESQEAVFFLNGEALDSFGPGRHTLETQNIPEIGKRLKRTTKEDPFHCEVYFINKTVQMSLLWGTDSKVRFIDVDTGVPLEIGASGSMNMEVSDGRKLLTKLVGTTRGITWDDEKRFAQTLQTAFRPMISSTVKTNIARAITDNKINILEVDRYLEKLSGTLHEKIVPEFEEYGLNIPQFYVTNVVLPEEDPNFQKVRELHTATFRTRLVAAEREVELEKQTTETEVAKREAERQLIAAKAKAEAMKMEGFAEAEVMRQKGYNEKDVIQAEVQKAFAQGIGEMGSNGGSAGGGTVSDIMGLGIGMAAAGAMSGPMSEMFKGFANISATPEDNTVQPAQSASIVCSQCGHMISEQAKFCPECGNKIEVKAADEVFCPNCGQKTKRGKFCMECGSKL